MPNYSVICNVLQTMQGVANLLTCQQQIWGCIEIKLIVNRCIFVLNAEFCNKIDRSSGVNLVDMKPFILIWYIE
jgi:hypothetical protein